MWVYMLFRQSWIEIEYFSVAYFERITNLVHCNARLPLRIGLMCFIDILEAYIYIDIRDSLFCKAYVFNLVLPEEDPSG